MLNADAIVLVHRVAVRTAAVQGGERPEGEEGEDEIGKAHDGGICRRLGSDDDAQRNWAGSGDGKDVYVLE